MSRVAKKPLTLPKGVECQVSDDAVQVKGPKGALSLPIKHPAVRVRLEGDVLQVETTDEEAIALAGTYRAILGNMVKGVSSGFEKKLELVGVGYRASMQGKTLSLSLGFSHPVTFAAPEGITIETPSQTEIVIRGADRQRVGEVAAKIRAFRPPEPYKGKGVRYAGEKIVLKQAKKT